MFSEGHSRAIAGIYKAVWHGSSGLSPLDILRDEVGAEHAMSRLACDGRTQEIQACSQLRLMDLEGFEALWNLGPLESQVRLITSGKSMRTSDILPLWDLLHSEFYHRLIRPIEGGLSTFYGAGDGREFTLTAICRSAERGRDFDADDLRLIDCLMPHVVSATTLQRSTRLAERALADLMAALDAMDDGIVLIDDASRVVHANARARSLAERGHFQLSSSAFRAARREDDTLLQEALHSAIGFAARSVIDAEAPPLQLGQRVTLGAPEGSAPLTVRVVPSTAGTAITARRGAVAAVVILSSTNDVSAGLMRQMMVQFGLTPREAELAVEFGRHADIVVAAHVLGITAATARQYLKSIFEKTGVHTQARLLRLIGG